MTFHSDLNREIANYERAEARAEREADMLAEGSDWHVNGEAARVIPEPGTFGTPAIWDDREVLGEES
jgi:hypothetical protein